jgi:hypothetical protein
MITLLSQSNCTLFGWEHMELGVVAKAPGQHAGRNLRFIVVLGLEGKAWCYSLHVKCPSMICLWLSPPLVMLLGGSGSFERWGLLGDP